MNLAKNTITGILVLRNKKAIAIATSAGAAPLFSKVRSAHSTFKTPLVCNESDIYMAQEENQLTTDPGIADLIIVKQNCDVSQLLHLSSQPHHARSAWSCKPLHKKSYCSLETVEKSYRLWKAICTRGSVMPATKRLDLQWCSCFAPRGKYGMGSVWESSSRWHRRAAFSNFLLVLGGGCVRCDEEERNILPSWVAFEPSVPCFCWAIFSGIESKHMMEIDAQDGPSWRLKIPSRMNR